MCQHMYASNEARWQHRESVKSVCVCLRWSLVSDNDKRVTDGGVCLCE